MSNTYVIGINGGGTHSSVVLCDNGLNVLARGEVGSTNYNNIGLQAAHAELGRGIQHVLEAASLRPTDIRGLGAGLSGLGRPHDHQVYQDIFAQLLPNARITLDNDATVALIAGAGQPFGVVIVSGTGSICVGMNEAQQRARAGGFGHYMDKGSGYFIAREGLAAIVAHYDGSGPATALTERLLTAENLSDVSQLVGYLYHTLQGVNEVAALSRHIVALADSDPVCARIIVQAADYLANLAIAVLNKLGLLAQPTPLVMSGSMFTYCRLLRDVFLSHVQGLAPQVIPILSEREAALGAAMMSLAAMGEAYPAPTLPPVPVLRKPSESRNTLTLAWHQRPTLDVISLMNIEDSRVAGLIQPQLPNIAQLIDAMTERFQQGGRVFLVGAGTSGRLAVLDAVECLPTFGLGADRVEGLLAGGLGTMLTASEGAEDRTEDGVALMGARQVGPLDSVIGIAASGSTPFVVGAVQEAAQRGALTGCIVNAAGGKIAQVVQYPIEVVTGPEVLMGSTRLKAGTAQKMILNMLSTALMVRIGRVYNNLMTDMLATNIKLHDRLKTIVAEATGLTRNESAIVLEQSDHQMKTAILMAKLNLTADQARAKLEQAHGNLSQLLD